MIRLQRELVAGVDHRRPHALARLAHRLVGEPDDGERRQARAGCRPRPRRAGRRRRRRRSGDAGASAASERAPRGGRGGRRPRRRASSRTRDARRSAASAPYGRSARLRQPRDRHAADLGALALVQVVPRVARAGAAGLDLGEHERRRRRTPRGRARRSACGGCARGPRSRGARSARRRAPRPAGPECRTSVMAATLWRRAATNQHAIVDDSVPTQELTRLDAHGAARAAGGRAGLLAAQSSSAISCSRAGRRGHVARVRCTRDGRDGIVSCSGRRDRRRDPRARELAPSGRCPHGATRPRRARGGDPRRAATRRRRGAATGDAARSEHDASTDHRSATSRDDRVAARDGAGRLAMPRAWSHYAHWIRPATATLRGCARARRGGLAASSSAGEVVLCTAICTPSSGGAGAPVARAPVAGDRVRRGRRVPGRRRQAETGVADVTTPPA